MGIGGITRVQAIRGLWFALVLAGLSACAGIERNHGYVPPPDDLAAITVGRDTRETVAEAIGRPGTSGILDDSGWYYVKSRRRTVAFRAPQEISREVVAISFNTQGTVTNIERFGLRDGRIVALTRRVTDSNTAGIGFLRQAFGNLGRFGPAGVAGDN